MRQREEKEVAKWSSRCYPTRAWACLIKLKLHFPLGKKTPGSHCAAQVGSRFRLLSLPPWLRKKSLKWKEMGWFLFVSKQSWLPFHVWVFLGCGNWLLRVFCLFSVRRMHCSLY